MNSRPHVAAIDFDSQNIYVAVGTRDTTSLTQPLLRADAYPNESIHRGSIIEKNTLTTLVGQICRTLETTYQYKLPMYIGIHPSSLISRRNQVTLNLFHNNQPRIITDEDIRQLTSKANSQFLTENPNFTILNTIPRQFMIDSTRLPAGASPTGYQASKLSCDILHIGCLTQDVLGYSDALRNYNAEIHEVFASPVATALLVTSPKQRLFGCGVLFVASDVTTFILFDEGMPALVHTYSIGIDDIIGDIAIGLLLPPEKARSLLADPTKLDDEPTQIRKKFNDIVHARTLDIVEMLQKTLISSGQPAVVPAGIITVTTNAQIPLISDEIKKVINIPSSHWEGDIPSTSNKKRSRDIGIIGAYSIICAAGSPGEPIKDTATIVKLLRELKMWLQGVISRFLS